MNDDKVTVVRKTQSARATNASHATCAGHDCNFAHFVHIISQGVTTFGS